MSKSLGTGIDPLDEIDVHGADALRFGLLAMSSSQDVRYSADRVQQGRDLANKMWNASRLVLLNAQAEQGRPQLERAEDRWILSRLQRTIASVSEKLDAYDFAHAALDLYEFFWSELCDWYLEMVKPRLYDGETEVGENLRLRPRAGAGAGPPDDAVRDRGDLELPARRGGSAGRWWSHASPRPIGRWSTRGPRPGSRRRSN